MSDFFETFLNVLLSWRSDRMFDTVSLDCSCLLNTTDWNEILRVAAAVENNFNLPKSMLKSANTLPIHDEDCGFPDVCASKKSPAWRGHSKIGEAISNLWSGQKPDFHKEKLCQNSSMSSSSARGRAGMWPPSALRSLE
jgi:hypothetical protein